MEMGREIFRPLLIYLSVIPKFLLVPRCEAVLEAAASSVYSAVSNLKNFVVLKETVIPWHAELYAYLPLPKLGVPVKLRNGKMNSNSF